MKHILSILIAFTLALSAFAQQNQVMKRSRSVFLYPEFREATIRQTFGRTLKATANILLKDASLVYREGDKVMHAYTKGIVGVDFDSVRYMKVDSTMARVVAQKGYNYLLCQTTVDMARLRAEETETRQREFFKMSDLNVFVDVDQNLRDDDLGYPLRDKYFFNVKGVVIPANEKSFRRFVGKDQLQAYEVLMENRFWSWRDAESLTMLLDFLPEK